MKGDARIIGVLNRALTVELTAVNQYFLHARMCKNWGYHKLAQKYYEEALGEMRHAETLIDRILFLEGTPALSMGKIQVGSAVKEQLENDLELETGGVRLYNAGVDLCVKVKDGASRELMEHILVESEEHVNWLESQLRVIGEVGLDNYLADQIGEGAGKE